MATKSPKSIAELFKNGQLEKLALEAERQRNLTDRIRKMLPSEEADHLVNVSIDKENELILVMDSPAWAARARYHAKTLGHEHIKVKVVPYSGI
ncbi:MAG: DciA family protein [Candidatus Rariloculaceae bacterium]|tara:strand:- start:353 stop:634 length:282 start_codon:yes stop_codon:yes gene_type:complete